jgi:anti-sigma factor RsiW
MNGHATPWLAAYHDGELKGRPLCQVEDHLTECAACRAELEELQKLTTLLRESPAADGLLPPERFVAQVGLRLPRRPIKPVWQRTLEAGWRLAPAGLVGAWAFVQAVFIVAGVALIVLQACGVDVLGLSPASQRETWLAAGLGLLGAEPGDTVQGALNVLNILGRGFVLYLSALVTIGLLYWSWLASLWARRRHQQWQAEAQLIAV